MVKIKLAVISLFALFMTTLPIMPIERSGGADSPLMRETVTFLDQGWNTEDRQMFYHTTQGTRVIPYKWFLALERTGLSRQPFLADEIVERYRLIPDPNTTNNPDRLPIGLVKEVAPDGEFIGVTCAACHTGQIAFNGAKIRIDGGPAMHNINGFFREMFEALSATAVNPLKFRRFSKTVLGERDNLGERGRLRSQMTATLKTTFAVVIKGELKHLYPTEEGFGRLDALGRGGNLVLARAIGDDRNFAVANAPVGFPHLWGTPSFDWVQYNGSIQQPMARNIGEALGVNAPVTLKGNPDDLFQSAVNVQNLHLLEEQVKKLTPPRWPEEILGRFDKDKAGRGEALYARHCAACHESRLAPPNEFGKQFLRINMFPLNVIGTDPTDATNFNKRVARTGQLALPPVGLPPTVTAASALEAVSSRIAERKYDELRISPEKQIEMNGFRANRIRAPLAYRARNMDGIWATAPYLHNNSVPNLYQLLLPAARRDTKFYVGNLEFDPGVVGFKTAKFTGGFEFHTSVAGNSNAGHEFRDGPRGKSVIGPLLTDAERWAIVEFLKTK